VPGRRLFDDSPVNQEHRTRRALRFVAGIFATAGITIVTTGLAAPPAQAEPAGLLTAEVSFSTADGQTLGGTVYSPRDATGKLPGLVLVHGSGPGKRKTLVPEAEAFARQGLVVLTYDKRSVGYSDLHRDYSLLASDAITAVQVLRQRAEVDAAEVGVWGISEGGWVVPIATARSTDIAFMVAASAPGLAPLRTQNWNMRNKVARAGISGSLARTLTSRAYRLEVDAGLFAEAYYDPRPALAGISQPVLAVYGTADDQIPPAESATVFQQRVPGPLTVRFLAGAGHALRTRDGHGVYTADLVPGYADLVGTWVRSVASGHTPQPQADPLPAQQSRSVALSPSAWWEGWPAQLTGLLLMLATFGAYPLLALVRKVRHRPVSGARAPRVLVAAGLTTVLGFLAYFGYVLSSTDAKGITAGPVMNGHSVIWLALQSASIITVIAAVLTVGNWRSAGLERPRLAIVLAGGVVFLPWALYWGLLLP
jgi:fermentation-respiration switch protein FrsA (DUF1100 family)